MSMDLADPVSSGKYCGTCVSTAPAVEPAVMSFTVSSSSDGAYDSMKGKYTILYFLYLEDVGCVCILNDWFCSIDEICPDNFNYFPV